MNHREQAYAELLLLQEQGVHMDAVAIHRAGYNAALALAHELAAALEDISRGGCCQSPGCSPDDPHCDANTAMQAVLAFHAATATPRATRINAWWS
jgi:hypothetical protein